MRKVLTAIVVLIVVVWLIPYDPLPDGELQVPPPVAPVVATPESGSTPATDNAPGSLTNRQLAIRSSRPCCCRIRLRSRRWRKKREVFRPYSILGWPR